MATHVFTYGSLMFAPVWEHVVAGCYRASPAVLGDHARYAIRNETYPGMIARPGATVRGLVYFEISAADLAALDIFEGCEYRRITVEVAGADGRAVTADTYLYLPLEKLAAAPWNPEGFALERFLATYCPAGSTASAGRDPVGPGSEPV